MSDEKPARLRVLVLTTSFPLTANSTSGVFVKQLTDSLSNSVEIEVLTPCPDYSLVSVSAPYPVHCFRYAVRQMQRLAHRPGGLPVAIRHIHNWPLVPLFFIAMFFSCVRYARKVQVIHANWSLNGVIAGVAGMVSGKPVITTLRGSDIERAERSWLDNFLLKICISMSDRIVTVSQSLADRTTKLFPRAEHELRVIPNGVSNKFLELNRENERTGTSFLVVANLIAGKGVDVVINAYRDAGLPDGSRLVIVGEGPERGHLEALIERFDLHGCITLMGSVSLERMPDMYAEADVLVHASYAEGRANVIMEAMAAGVAVIGSDIPGTSEIVRHGENGMLFRPGDTEQLGSLMNMMAGDRHLRRHIADNGRSYITAQGLTWENSAIQYLSLYRDLVTD